MELTAGLDSGPVCLQEPEPIDPQDNYGTLAGRLEGLGGELLVRALDERPSCAAQDESLATYAEKITAADRALDPQRPADELERVVRALTPHIGAHVRLGDGGLLGVERARVLIGQELEPGVLSLDGERPVLGCARDALELLIVRPAGRRSMSGEAYLRGVRR
jgi:methionyl-tRNA formyltransferase